MGFISFPVLLMETLCYAEIPKPILVLCRLLNAEFDPDTLHRATASELEEIGIAKAFFCRFKTALFDRFNHKMHWSSPHLCIERSFACQQCVSKAKVSEEEAWDGEEIVEACKTFDLDGNGFISVTELCHVVTNLKKYAEEEFYAATARATAAASAAGLTVNGQIKYVRFVEMMIPRVMTSKTMTSKTSYSTNTSINLNFDAASDDARRLERAQQQKATQKARDGACMTCGATWCDGTRGSAIMDCRTKKRGKNQTRRYMKGWLHKHA